MLKVFVYKIKKQMKQVKLPQSIIDHVNAYTNKAARYISLFSWTKAYELLKEHKFNFSCLSFNNRQQPIIKKSKLYFNISHSENYVAIAISDNPVGIDIQAKVNANQAKLVSKRLLSKKQYADYLKSKDKGLAFTTFFTQMESEYKLKHFSSKKHNKFSFNTFSFGSNNQKYSLTIVNEKGENLEFREIIFDK